MQTDGDRHGASLPPLELRAQSQRHVTHDPRVVPLLEVDSELAYGLTPAEREQAAGLLEVRVLRLERGDWEPPSSGPATAYGLLLLDGLIARRTRVGRGVALELLGPGDILRPWEALPYCTVEPRAAWQVLVATRLAVLDSRVTALAGRWPALTINLSARLLRRSRTLSYLLAVSHMLKVEDRVLGTLWQLASTWGRVTRDGVVVPFALTHQALGQIIGAQRPSVTCALSVLQQRGRVQRRDGRYLLLGDPPDWNQLVPLDKAGLA
jgi:CRP-like cAMP-binding protein